MWKPFEVFEHANRRLDVQIYHYRKAGMGRKYLIGSSIFLVVFAAVFTLFGTVSNDRGAQFMLAALLGFGACVIARKILDCNTPCPSCGNKLQSLDSARLAPEDREYLTSNADLKMKTHCTYADILECPNCLTFCYIRTHDGAW